MTGPKLNEAPVARPNGRRAEVGESGRTGTRAVARYVRVSPYKVREVLDLIRGKDVERALEILRFSERDAAIVVGKVLGSAVANAEHNDALVADELYVSACFADEGPTLKRWRPRARGRATRIRKRTCHVTVIVSRLPDDELTTRRAAQASGRRARRAGQTAAEQRRRLGRRRGAAEPGATEEVTAAEEAALAAEPEGLQEEAVADVAESSAEAAVETTPVEAPDDSEQTAVTAEEVVASQDATGTTEEQTTPAADAAETPSDEEQ
jgi:large subunit ribosomal protein L22